MAAESPIRMLQTQESWTSHKGAPTFSADEEALLVKGYRYLGKRGIVLNRSGSAPPNMEGSLASIENIIQNSGLSSERGSEGRLVSSSSSVSDNSPYSDLVFQFHHQHLGSSRFGKLTPFSGSSDNLLHLSQSSLPTHEEESEDDRSPQKTDNFTYRSSAVWSGQESSPSIGQSINIANLKDGSTSMSSLSDDQSNTLHHGSASDGTNTRVTDSSSLQEQSISYDSRQGSSPSIHSHEDPSITNILPENKISFSDETDINSVQNRMKALKISCPPNSENHGIQVEIEPNFQTTLIQRPSGFQFPHSMPQIASQGTNNSYVVANQFFHGGNFPSTEAQPVLHSSTFTPPLHMPSSPYYANVQPPGIIYPPHYYMSGYPYNANVIPPFLSGYPPHNAFDINAQAPELWGGSPQGVDIQHANRFYGHAGFPQPLLDPRLQVQPHHSFGDSMGTPRSSSNTGLFMHLSHSPLSSPVLPQSPMGSGSSPSSVRSASAHPGWQGLRGFEGFHYKKPYSFLEDLKSGKGRRFELSDIAGHVVEFSVDQHGSRFIQQKLENCSIEDKASVFQEVLPHASKLMTDVFGNYVIQKFFEYGTPEQRRDLANALRSQILPLSLQMYGCRVIQKALDVIELEQKAELVRELDGHVMRCVRDQNGNHVIQKCIECIPTDKISFMIYAFRGQVPGLSMHPYGCRVIQRVLERCTSELQSQFIVDEILESVCTLAQDQYGNYVTQHVLERGKPQERTQIIKNLGGQVVKMSQHKFASNVVEKCLEYGEPDARELLIVEVIGQDDVNDNLLVMMKDQYANYVVQKILETCTESQREQLLRRIRVHLHSLKKYTYGKHIAVRFEQLIGESLPPATGS